MGVSKGHFSDHNVMRSEVIPYKMSLVLSGDPGNVLMTVKFTAKPGLAFFFEETYKR